MAEPTDRDRHQNADYSAFVEALAREGLPLRTEATRAAEAVACALAQRISHADFDDLREALPEPFRGRLFACERHAALPPRRETETPDAEGFYAMVAEDLDRSPDDVEPAVRAVFQALRAQVPEEEGERIAGLLPAELGLLWRRAS
jgi:uncharacterized protein (DUF2267 family)